MGLRGKAPSWGRSPHTPKRLIFDWERSNTRYGKQNYKCRDCGRQFARNPQWQKVSNRTQDSYELLEKLLLEKIPLDGILLVP